MNTKLLLLSFTAVLSLATAYEVDCKNPPKALENPRNCCPAPSIISDEMKEKCTHVAYPGEGHDHPTGHDLMHNVAFVKCINDELGMVENGVVDKPKLKAYMEVRMKDVPDMMPVFETAFKDCYGKWEEFKKKSNDFKTMHPEVAQKVRPHPHFHPGIRVMSCIFREVFVNCAPSVWTSTEECNQWRDVLKTCEPAHRYWHKNFHNTPSSSEEDDELHSH